MTTPHLDRATAARFIDHTLLRPEARPDDVRALCAEATELGVYAVCVNPSMTAVARRVLDEGIALAVVCGCPSGAHLASVKAAEAAAAVDQGADEVDMVVNLGLVRSGDWGGVEADIAAVRAAVPTGVLKVILESSALTDDEIVRCCQVAEAVGADFVKTSTGFHPSGGASADVVRLMSQTVGGRLGVKASGGIRTSADLVAMVGAGATRIGCSATRDILGGLRPKE